jgi:hypothetical protein
MASDEYRAGPCERFASSAFNRIARSAERRLDRRPSGRPWAIPLPRAIGVLLALMFAIQADQRRRLAAGERI